MSDRTMVEAEVDGKRYAGSYEVSRGGIVTVRTPYRRKSAQVGGSPPKVIAQMLLRELVRAERARPDSMI
jgi:hypothetical protein